jgi:hypothetical protein
MSSQPIDPPIIISGGSVSINVPVGLFLGLLLGGVFTNNQKEIKRVEITGSGLPNYDESASNSDITITIEYGNP